MKKGFLTATLLIISITLSQKVHAQYYFFDDTYYDQPILYEAGISVNAMNCLTDLGGKKGIGQRLFKDLNLGYTHLSGGIFFCASYKNQVALRLEGTFGKVSSEDVVLKGITDIAKERFNRNLNFQSNISEVALLVEVHPLLIFIDWPAKDRALPRYSPYLLGGVGYFSFNPQTTLGGRIVDLQPYSTEGQGFAEYPDRKVYSLTQLNIPLGGGVKYEVGPLVNLRAEFVYRKTFTDYLDDLSTTYIDPALFDKYFSPQKAQDARALSDKQIVSRGGAGTKRGTATENDGYFTFNIKIGVIIGRERMKR